MRGNTAESMLLSPGNANKNYKITERNNFPSLLFLILTTNDTGVIC